MVSSISSSFSLSKLLKSILSLIPILGLGILVSVAICLDIGLFSVEVYWSERCFIIEPISRNVCVPLSALVLL